MKPRVHELAAEYGMSSRALAELLGEIGEFVKGPSSTVEPIVARRLRLLMIERGYPSPKPIGELISGRKEGLRAAASSDRDEYRAVLQSDPIAPSRNQYGWYSNPVPEPKYPSFDSSLRRAARDFPQILDHRAALRALGSQFVYIAPATHPVLKGATVALIRFSGAIESAFGLTREVMVLYVPYRDLQIRTFESAFDQVKTLNRPITPDAILLVSPDDRASTKLSEWSTPGRLGIPFSFDDSDPLALIGLLGEHLHTRDLFLETTPVRGAKFFGRRALLQSLRGDIIDQKVLGVFGLRKAGKTSVLLQLQEDLRVDQVVAVLVDLEQFPLPPEDPIDDVLAETRSRIIAELKERGISAHFLERCSIRPSILEFKNALQAQVGKLGERNIRILLMLDEIEHLTPMGQINVAEAPLPRIGQFFASLRSVVQETENFSFLIAGLTSAVLESGRLYGRPNPLFSWATSVWVGAFTRREASSLAETIGARMGLRIDPGALDAIYEATGGHAYLFRHLASAVTADLDVRSMQRRMTRADVLAKVRPWSEEVRGNIREIFDHVERYYPLEWVFLQLVREDGSRLKDLLTEEPEAARNLKRLGLLVERDNEWSTSVVLELL